LNNLELFSFYNMNMSGFLVVTVALKSEVPVEWLRQHRVPVLTAKDIEDGRLSEALKQRGMISVVTGVGYENSRNAALKILEKLKPGFVFNIGSCGVRERSIPLNRWIRPNKCMDVDGRIIEIDTTLPIPYPDGIIDVDSIMSIHDPSVDLHIASSIVDMETFSQAEVFRGSDVTFHVLKYSTDYADRHTNRDFKKNLPLMREEIKKLFSFVMDRHSSIGVIIPVHNRRDTIKRAIDSVLSQTHPPDEIIVVDDNSTDGTREIIEEYGDSIKRVYFDKNSGPSIARNRGVKDCSCPWIALLDSDDCWERNKLKRQVEYLDYYPFYEIIQSEEKWIRNGVRVNPCKHHKKPIGWVWKPSLKRCLISPSGVIMKKALFEKYGGFREDLPVCEDYDLWLRISRWHPVGLDPEETVIKYGGHEDQLSRRYEAMDRFRVRSMLDLLKKETHPEFRKALIDELSFKIGILIKGCRKRGKTEEAEYYEELLKTIGVRS